MSKFPSFLGGGRRRCGAIGSPTGRNLRPNTRLAASASSRRRRIRGARCDARRQGSFGMLLVAFRPTFRLSPKSARTGFPRRPVSPGLSILQPRGSRAVIIINREWCDFLSWCFEPLGGNQTHTFAMTLGRLSPLSLYH